MGLEEFIADFLLRETEDLDGGLDELAVFLEGFGGTTAGHIGRTDWKEVVVDMW